MSHRLCAVPAALVLCGLALAGQPELNPRLRDLEPSRWLKLHEQAPGDAVRFQRQEHGGSCFDPRRGHLILFGSNTHGKDWTNSPLVFDVAACAWSRLYPDDPRSAYAVSPEGLPVAGEKGGHPWAMHTFGALVCDPERDEMVVCCWPAHMVPGRFSNALEGLWDQVKRHPTWTFDLSKHEWRALPCKAEHFFSYCAAYDSGRKAIVGYRPDGIYELGGEPREWKRAAPKGFFGWHTNAAYDAKNKALIVFGSNENSNDVVVYRPATGEHGGRAAATGPQLRGEAAGTSPPPFLKMPTPGERPPKDQHCPMCFDPGSGKVVVVVDRAGRAAATGPQLRGEAAGTSPPPFLLDQADPKKAQAETWLYDLAADAWTQLPTATLPFACGMNYNLEYDPNHEVCLLVTGTYGQPTAVWAMRIDARVKR